MIAGFHLGIMTWEFARALQPDRVLVVREPGAEAKGFTPHLDRYPGASVAPFHGGQLNEAFVREWLAGLDVVYSAETFYDWHMVTWAREAGAATVLHVMPEFWHPHLPPVTATWIPTPWRAQHIPHARLVPVPVAADRFPLAPPEPADRLRVLHVAGHRAAHDRNGTQQLLQALRLVRQPMTVRMTTQDPSMPRSRVLGRSVDLDIATGGRGDYWGLYGAQDVLVLPRRYGGLSLPVQEAMAAGLAVVMPDVSPNDWWPTLRVAALNRGVIETAAGPIPLAAAQPRAIAQALDELAADRHRLIVAQAGSVAWARDHSWDALSGLYRAELDAAAAAR